MQDIEDLDNDQLQKSLQWEEDDQQTKYKAAKLKDLFPINYIEMRDKFFAENMKMNPHFMYNTVVSPQVFPIHHDYQKLALKILHNSAPYPSNIPLLNEDQVRQKIDKYLDNLGLSEFVQVDFLFQTLSRTSVAFFKDRAKLRVRIPLSYTQINLEGVLNHQIGTHVVRTLNHRQNCVRKPSQKGKIIEQGLAAINQLLPQPQPFLFKPALRYMAAIYGSQCDFVTLYKKLNKYVKDPHECWRQCVRVKRGVSNTEQKGGYYKDQNYLIGAVEILSNRKKIDFQKIYYGKLTPDETKNLSTGVLPPFIDTEQKLKHYLKKLDSIAIVNFIDELNQQKQQEEDEEFQKKKKMQQKIKQI